MSEAINVIGENRRTAKTGDGMICLQLAICAVLISRIKRVCSPKTLFRIWQ